MAEELRIRYEWDPEKGPIDMRRFGRSILGIERMLSVGLYATETGKFPGNSVQLPFSPYVIASRSGSIELLVAMTTYLSASYLIYAIPQDNAASFLMDFIMSVINRTGGRNDRAMDLLEDNSKRMLDMIAADQRRSADLINRLVDIVGHPRMRKAARNCVAPLDSGDKKIVFDDGETGSDEIDFRLAGDVNNGSRAQFGDIEDFLVRVDGFSHHNQHLKLVHPEDTSRYITARVLDPIFETPGNVYLRAATEQGYLAIRAKPLRQQGRLTMLYIMDAFPADPPPGSSGC